MAEKQNRPWTEEDDRRLLELKAAGRSAVSIAAALKRSPGAIHGRLGAIRDKKKAAKEPRHIEQ
jgi:uncharacterized protein (DUF2252 family)